MTTSEITLALMSTFMIGKMTEKSQIMPREIKKKQQMVSDDEDSSSPNAAKESGGDNYEPQFALEDDDPANEDSDQGSDLSIRARTRDEALQEALDLLERVRRENKALIEAAAKNSATILELTEQLAGGKAEVSPPARLQIGRGLYTTPMRGRKSTTVAEKTPAVTVNMVTLVGDNTIPTFWVR